MEAVFYSHRPRNIPHFSRMVRERLLRTLEPISSTVFIEASLQPFPSMTESTATYSNLRKSERAGEETGRRIGQSYSEEQPGAVIVFASSRHEYGQLRRAIAPTCSPDAMVAVRPRASSPTTRSTRNPYRRWKCVPPACGSTLCPGVQLASGRTALPDSRFWVQLRAVSPPAIARHSSHSPPPAMARARTGPDRA